MSITAHLQKAGTFIVYDQKISPDHPEESRWNPGLLYSGTGIRTYGGYEVSVTRF
ncbi:hypothetical protein [Desulfonatronovibrio magnus]|uniref:hypothetical protein n=1 Tax=Desulfonatronovibrio magnus TaxID=698827 RepID=UPI0012F8C80F|nr:hypothetical protein [Desulfonatronovibrio magnus]